MNFKLWMSVSVATLVWAGAAQAQTQSAPASSTQASSESSLSNGVGSQDVIVTAQKREERLVNVPAAITALQGATLKQIGAKTLSDFTALVPGLQLATQGGGGGQELVLRGLSTGTQQDSALVGEVVDGVPVGSSSTYALGGASALDSGLWDINRVEVLRGPQGTLYGANAMGGLISYIYNQPDVRRFGGSLEAEGSATPGAADSWSLRGEINVPIVDDQLALRVSAFEDNGGGYIDDPAQHKNNINQTVDQGVRAALLWKPNDRFTANLEAIYQHDHWNATDEASYYATSGAPVQGSLDQKYALDPGSFDYDELALTLSYDFGPVTLTSISSYEYLKNDQNTAFTDTIDGPLFTNPTYLALFGIPGPAAANMNFEDTSGTNKYSEELRVASNGSGPLKYLAGFFTTHETSFGNLLFSGDDAHGAPLPTMNPGLITGNQSVYDEYAGFAQVSYTVFDRLTFTGGLRYNYIRQSYLETLTGPYAAPLVAFHILTAPAPLTRGDETDVNYLVDARYAVTPHSNLYARVATGFRPGGPNVAIAGLPATFASDKITDYEAGYKASLFGGRVQFDADVFYIDWRDIQLRASAGGLTGEVNGGQASSRGVEAEGSFVPVDGLTVGGNIAYVDAHLDQSVPSTGGVAGDPLPLSAKWSGAVFATYTFPIADAWDGFVGGNMHAVSARNISYPGGIVADNPNFVLKPYLLGDIRAGVEHGPYMVTLFIDNVGDSRAELSAQSTDELVANVGEVSIARLRTFGVRLDAKF